MTSNTIQTCTYANLPLATGVRRGAVRFDTTNNRFVVSNGTSWVPQNIENKTVNLLLNASCVHQCFFTATRACKVIAVSEVHATAGTDGSAVSLQVTKDTGTDAPGAGTDLLTNNTNAGFNMKGTANTVQNGTLVATAATVTLAAGNRLSLDFAGTITTLAGVQVTVTLELLA